MGWITREPSAFAFEPDVFTIICLPAVWRHNRLCRMAEPAHATVTTPVPLSQTKVIVIKIIALTVISVVLILGQSWASTRFYRPDYAASFPTGLLEGALMPAALPARLAGGKGRADLCAEQRRSRLQNRFHSRPEHLRHIFLWRGVLATAPAQTLNQ